ncbi:MAG: AAA family ATPase [Alphaproteobacteria bacterium]|nr:AAA family ATPase [Alphaproteobacteria bacterium]
MPALESITIKGFKSIASVEKLLLRPINVVIGPNGAGKSNFIGIFEFLRAIREGKLQDYVARAGGAERILHFGSKHTDAVHIKIAFQDWVNQYEIVLEPTDADELVPSEEWGYYWDKARYPNGPMGKPFARQGKEAGVSRDHLRGIGHFVAGHLERWRVYHFHDTSSSSPMKKTCEVNDNRALRADGSNLAPFLHRLRQQFPASYDLIRKSVQRVAPFFDDFRLEPTALNPDKIRLEWKHKRSDAYFDAAALSDGTLRFIALATLLLQPEILRPSVILVDEPELGLHPYAVALLAALVRQASGQTQVILSTQSPQLLDHFEPEDILVASQKDGGTAFDRLDPARLEDWLQDYSLGQLWEKGEFGGRPGEGG